MAKKKKHPEYVVESKFWYRDQYRRSLFLCLILSGILFLSLTFNGLQFFLKPSPQYFAATDDFRIQKLVPLDKPYITQAGLLNWASRTVVQTLQLDFAHWRDTLQSVRNNYTEKAFAELFNSLNESGNLDMVRQKRLIVTASIEKAPVVTASGILQGRKAWRIQMPIVLSYESSEGVENSQKLLAKITAHRVSTTEHPKGVKITQLVLK